MMKLSRLAVLAPLSLLVACGGDDSATSTTDVVINEVFAKSSVAGNADWVELHNRGAGEIDLTGWSLRDAKDRDPYPFDGVRLAAGDYLVVQHDETGVSGFVFGLGNADAVRLFDPSGAMVDRAAWEDNSQLLDQSLGRLPDGTGELTILTQPTRGGANRQ